MNCHSFPYLRPIKSVRMAKDRGPNPVPNAFTVWYWFAPEGLAIHPPYRWTCYAIQRAVPTARVSYPGSELYTSDTYHWLPSSSQASACSVEPATVQDVSKIIKILGRHYTPFAIKAGGRATNPGFSSTPGVQIALSGFKDVTYNKDKHTATAGAGLSWAELYTKLQPLGVTVVGGRIVGVGMLLILFPPGYSYISNRHGLVTDNIVAFELVLPNGEITVVTAQSDPDLSWALKGGYNNFGIITRYVFKTYSLGNVWGGGLIYTQPNINLVVSAVADFQASNTNVDATVVAVYTRVPAPVLSVTLFYNGSTQPPNIFDKFFDIPRAQEDVKTRTYTDLITAASAPFLKNDLRGAMHTYYFDGGGKFTDGASLIVFIEPFINTGGVTSSKNDSSYPITNFTPLSLLWRWPGAGSDHVAREDLKKRYTTREALHLNLKLRGQEKYDPYKECGRYNNFVRFECVLNRSVLNSIQGIITRYVFKTYSLGNVWGGGLIYTQPNINLVVSAVADFQASNTNVDATVVAPPNIFDKFFDIPRAQEDVKTRTYTDLITAASAPFLKNDLRGAMHTVSLTDLTVGVINQILHQTDYYFDGGGKFTDGASLIVFIEPFINTGGVTSSRTIRRIEPSNSVLLLNLRTDPFSFSFQRWPGAGSDHVAREDLKKVAAAITATAESEGQQLADLPLYSDYSLSDIPLEKLYTVNLPKLQRLRKKYDPYKSACFFVFGGSYWQAADEHISLRLVMNLAGGFHF
ncbi:hypothetical protein BS47DRAFT_1394234 [Hydnum rufescens UP504]|uniref:FAD-binding PCMH-type domain-containing protein n=1 Tax=Hydnum rufescens UP504 TaxID=1448309 RepID=A0A9P6AUP2_9AGAM|nr:hypothetical protein BS47DRAFT_1394234 [Hydnum rufescens UP504]